MYTFFFVNIEMNQSVGCRTWKENRASGAKKSRNWFVGFWLVVGLVQSISVHLVTRGHGTFHSFLHKLMELVALLTLVASAQAVEFGNYQCNNNCQNTEKYGKVIGTAQAAEMPGVGVFGAYHGNLYWGMFQGRVGNLHDAYNLLTANQRKRVYLVRLRDRNFKFLVPK